jgi:hypothetical protein
MLRIAFNFYGKLRTRDRFMILKNIWRTYWRFLLKILLVFAKNIITIVFGPWRRGAVDIAFASETEDPGSNPARVEGF